MLAPVCHVTLRGLPFGQDLQSVCAQALGDSPCKFYGDYRTDRGLCLLSMQEPVQKRGKHPQKGGIQATGFGAVYRRSPGGYAAGKPSASAAAGSTSPAVSGLEGSFSVAEASSGVT